MPRWRELSLAYRFATKLAKRQRTDKSNDQCSRPSTLPAQISPCGRFTVESYEKSYIEPQELPLSDMRFEDQLEVLSQAW